MRILVAAIGLVLVGHLVMTAGFMVSAGSPSEPDWWPTSLAFLAWCSAPSGVIGLLSYFGRERTWPLVLNLAAALAVLGVAAYTLIPAFQGPADAQVGLVFLFMPVFEGVVAFPLWVATGVMLVLARRAPGQPVHALPPA